MNYEPGSFCASCGACCKSYPGGFYPSDFIDLTEVREGLRLGLFAIDCWEADEASNYETLYYIRPSVKGKRSLVDRSYGGECIMLTPTGCGLGAGRPTECKQLKPKDFEAGICRSDSGKLAVAKAWDQNFILRLIEELS